MALYSLDDTPPLSLSSKNTPAVIRSRGSALRNTQVPKRSPKLNALKNTAVITKTLVKMPASCLPCAANSVFAVRSP